MKRLATVLSASAVAMLSTSAQAQQVIRIDGSPIVYPITEGVVKEFQKAKGDAAKVMLNVSSTSSGFKKLCKGETDISNVSRPILTKEMEECKKNGIQYFELPIAYDGIAVIANSGNTWATCMTVEQLREIWKPESQGKKLMWSDIDAKWPKEEIKLCGPPRTFGTFDYFTEAITGQVKHSRFDYFASENFNTLVEFAQKDKGALCYLTLTYAQEGKGKIKVIQIKNPKTGQCVEPTQDTIQKGQYQPLSRPLFIYVNAKSAQDRPEVKEFVEFYLKNASRISKRTGNVPLPDRAYKQLEDRLAKRAVGTVFGGEPEIGLTIDDILKREPKQ